MRRSTRPRRLPNLMWLALSLMVSLTLIVPAMYVFGPDVHRWVMIRDLTADDADRRERALNYVLRLAGEDERVRQGAIRQLEEVEDDEKFRQLTRALDLAGVWRRPTVPDDPWLRWLMMIAELDEPRARLRAAQRVAALPELADDARVRSLLERLLNDETANVRYNALAATAELAGAADDRLPYEAMIASRADDDESVIAREAWLLIGLLDPLFGYSANWREADPWVAEAMLWASVQTNPDRPAAAVEALADESAPASVRRAAAYALAFAEPGEAEAALLPAIEAALEAEVEADSRERLDGVVLWRTVRGVPLTDASRDALQQLAEARHSPDAQTIDRVELAARHRIAAFAPYTVLHEPALDDEPGVNPEVLRELAALERRWLEPDAWAPVAREWAGPLPDMLRLVYVATMAEPAVDDLLPLLSHDEPAMRDLACVVAVERFDDATLEPVIGELLVDYHDAAKMSGAMLSGMTGLQTALLRDRAGRQHDWAMAQMMRLGLWMQGELPAMSGQAAWLLGREELPRTSVLLAMLEAGPGSRRAAWDYLLAPQGEPAMDLVRLFDHYRWWYVARRRLPGGVADAPPFWWWADREVQRFQVDVLRNWYLLQRHGGGGSDF
ncbi:MAG: hypothetical protein WDZ31_08550 [Phycisphaeraceae bacterium]